MKSIPFVMLSLSGLLFLSGCVVVEVAPEASAPQREAPRPVTSAEPVDSSGARSVVARLKKAGLLSSIVSKPTAGDRGSLFDPGEFVLRTRGGAELHVFVFASAHAAKATAAEVRPNGIRTPRAGGDSSMGTFMSPEYPAPAHFFKGRRSIVVYFEAKEDLRSGEADRVLDALRDAYGEEFALSRQ